MNKTTFSLFTWIVLDITIFIGAAISTGVLGTILMCIYFAFPTLSLLSLGVLLAFMYNPEKFTIKDIPGSDDLVNLDLTMFNTYKEVYSNITKRGKTASIYWLADALTVGLALYFVDNHAPNFALAVIILVITEVAMREHFIGLVNDRGEAFKQAEENLRKLGNDKK